MAVKVFILIGEQRARGLRRSVSMMNNEQNRNRGGSQGMDRDQQNQGGNKPGQQQGQSPNPRDREQQDQQGGRSGQQGGGTDQSRQPR